MAQVRSQYLRAVVLHKRATHADGLKDLAELKIVWSKVLKALPQEDFEMIRDRAFKWLFSLPKAEMDRVLAEYDALPKPMPMPYRIDWTKQVPFMHPGTLTDRNV